jgi:integrative and conjugative element protein (TIGR02256 family)
MQVIFSERAYTAILEETAEKIKTETGGVFLGCYENGIWYVIESIDPGPKSIFQVAYFEYDQKYTEHLINKIARLYQADLTLIGLWHRHPGSLDEFSSTDGGTNSDYARLSPNGAISVLVNIDPAFRMTPYHVGWPLKYTKITYKVSDELIPEHLLILKNTDQSLEYVNSYANKSYTGNTSYEKPKVDFARLLNGIKHKLQKMELTKEDTEQTGSLNHRDLLIDSLLDDISYFSETRGLMLNIEQSDGSLYLVHKGANNTVTKTRFVYLPGKEQIIFSYDDICYLYTPGMFSELLADYNPPEATFKSGLLRAMGLSKEKQDEEKQE